MDTKSLIPTFLRKRIEMACDYAENPKGMGVHDGMALFHAADIRRLLLVIDHLAKPAAVSKEYAKHNPLGGVARMFDIIADRLRAGEDYYDVLDDYSLQPKGTDDTCMVRPNQPPR